tara:strand:+ start:1145 stop:2233 length:1089 start_codon:yes stop_codon:yes gene_type:complete
MHEDPREAIEELLRRASAAHLVEERWRIGHEAARLADYYGVEPELRYRANRKAFRGAAFSGRTSEALVAFGRLVAAYDTDPELTSPTIFLSDYGMAIGELICLKIPRAEVEKSLTDFKLRLERAGFSPRAFHRLRWALCRDMGLAQEAERAYQAAKQYPRDALADCLACETDNAVEIALEAQDMVQAERLAAPLFEGDLSCGSKPAVTYSRFLRPYFFEGRFEDAERCFRLGLPGVRGSRAQIGWAADFLEYLAFVGDPQRGGDLAREILELLPEVESRHCSFECYRVLALWLECRESLSLHSLPRGAPPGAGSDPGLLRQWARNQAVELGELLDERNKTPRYAERILEGEGLLRRARELRP